MTRRRRRSQALTLLAFALLLWTPYLYLVAWFGPPLDALASIEWPSEVDVRWLPMTVIGIATITMAPLVSLFLVRLAVGLLRSDGEVGVADR